MKYIVDSREMKLYDQHTIERIGLSQAVLMERAALAVAERVLTYLRDKAVKNPRVLVMAGAGNNGGDGLAVARLLAEREISVCVYPVGNTSKSSEGFKLQQEILSHYDIPFVDNIERSYSVLVDALFGVGLSRKVEGLYAEAVTAFNEAEGYKIAVDVPSGISADTGAILGCACRVDETVSFAYLKKGLLLYPGKEPAVTVTVPNIGISHLVTGDEEPKLFCYEDGDLTMPKRCPGGNKGTFGKVLLIAGSYQMAGAAVLSSTAIFRSGAGMVKILSCEENRVIFQSTVPEAMLGTYEDFEQSEKWADIIEIGPGLSTSLQAREIVTRAVRDSRLPLVLDADALNIVASDRGLREALKEQCLTGRTVIMTPHVGELSRLCGHTIKEIQQDLHSYAKALAMELQCIVAAKDAVTIICRPEGSDCINCSGNSGLATAGSGDVLAGIIAAFLAQGMDAFTAASAGCFRHGKIAEMVTSKIGEHACMAGDIAACRYNFTV